MRKNINKIVAIAIGISVMSANALPVFAAETGQTTTITSADTQNVQKKILTVQQAVDAAIENSDKFKLKTKEIKKYRDEAKVQRKINDAKKDVDDDLDDDDKDVIDFPYDKLNITADQTEQAQGFLKDQIKNDITSKYNDIVSTEIAIDKAKKNIEIQTTKLNDLKLKNQLGLTIDTDVKSTELQIQSLKDSVTAKENTLKDKKDYFQVLTEINLADYTFDHSLDYKTFRVNGSIDNYVADKLDDYFKYNEKLFNATKDYVGDVKSASDYDEDVDDQVHDFDEPNKDDFKDITKTTTSGEVEVVKNAYDQWKDAEGTYTGELSSYSSYLDLKYGVDSNRVTIDESKKTLTNSIKGLYSQLLDYENQIAQVQENIKLTNKQLEFAKLRYDMGLTTKSDYDNTILKAQDLDTNLRTLVNTYNTLKDEIQEPWLLSGNN